MECMFRIPKDGKKVIWEITNQCNYLCKYCIFNSNSKKNKNELTTSECVKVIDDLYRNGYRYIKITGGEPFIRKDLIKIVDYAKKKDFNIDISTNASLLDLNIVKKLKSIQVDMIHVSLDGFDRDSQEEIRGKNTYNRTINGIKQLKDNNIYVRVGTVIYSHNENHLKDIVDFVIKLNVDEIIFSIMEPVGRMKNDYHYYKKQSMHELTYTINLLQKEYKDKIMIHYNWDVQGKNHVKTCPAGDTFIYINHLGQISPCTWLSTKDSKYLSVETLKNKDLSYLLNTGEIKKYLDYKQGIKCNECATKRNIKNRHKKSDSSNNQ